MIGLIRSRVIDMSATFSRQCIVCPSKDSIDNNIIHVQVFEGENCSPGDRSL